jgi:hypothetical protein
MRNVVINVYHFKEGNFYNIDARLYQNDDDADPRILLSASDEDEDIAKEVAESAADKYLREHTAEKVLILFNGNEYCFKP